MYGGKGGAQALAVNAKQVSAILRSASGHNTIFKVKTQDAEQTAIVKDWQVDPVKGQLLHVDLLRIAMDVRMRVKVPIHTFGEAQGVKLQGGVFEMVTREVEIECLPSEIPTEFRMDISGLMMGMQLRRFGHSSRPRENQDAYRSRRVYWPTSWPCASRKRSLPKQSPPKPPRPPSPKLIKKGKKEAEEGEEGEEAPAPEKEKKK